MSSFPSSFRATFCFAILASIGLANPATASGDDDCDPHLRVPHRRFSRCDSLTAMSPGNDTRVNLLLLLTDHDHKPTGSSPPSRLPASPEGYPAALVDWRDLRNRWFPAPDQKPGYATGEGSRCQTDAGGTTAFVEAIEAAHAVPQDERAALIAKRKALSPTCPEIGVDVAYAAPTDAISRSPIGQAFETYLSGAGAFYDGQYQIALAQFVKLHRNPNPWLADSGDYMVARTQVNLLQKGAFDEYGAYAGAGQVDEAVAESAEIAFLRYLDDHPNGAYGASARGLLLRVDWLADKTARFATHTASLLSLPPDQRGVDDGALSEDIADKLLPQLDPDLTRDPILLATVDLLTMREPSRLAKKDAPPPPRVDLEGQRDAFAKAVPLYEYLLATQAFYVDGDAAKVLTLLPDDTKRRDGDHLWFSRQVLRGLALEEKHDRNVRGFWKELYAGLTGPLDQQLVQLALAMHDERAGTPADAFAPGSIVTNTGLRDILIEKSADAALLRKIAGDASASQKERELASQTLLRKEITRGRYEDFLRDIALMPGMAEQDDGGFGCPKLTDTAAQLAADPEATRARLCIADYVRTKDIVESSHPADELGGGPSMFPGKTYDRASTYESIIADRNTPASDRAYALYRAVKCYEPSGGNACGGPDVPKPERRRWYNMLKHDYPASSWAKDLPYWW